MSSRESVARVLHRAGALELALRLRARLRSPYLTVLTYHHVADPDETYAFDPDVADATPEQFARQMEVVARHFTAIGIDQLCDALDGGRLPPNPVLITFDDGYRSCLETAAPILARNKLRAVFFVATGFVSSRTLYWWERIAWTVRHATVPRLKLGYPEPLSIELAADAGQRGAAAGTLAKVIKNTAGLDLPRFLDELTAAARVDWSRTVEQELVDQLIMGWDEIRQLRDAGMDIESHTRNHRVLQTLDAGGLADELAGSREDIARELGRAPRAVAYPVGRTIVKQPHIRDAVRAAGYRVGFSNANGINALGWRPGAAPNLDPFDVRRVAMERNVSLPFFVGQLAVPQLAYVSAGHDY